MGVNLAKEVMFSVLQLVEYLKNLFNRFKLNVVEGQAMDLVLVRITIFFIFLITARQGILSTFAIFPSTTACTWVYIDLIFNYQSGEFIVPGAEETQMIIKILCSHGSAMQRCCFLAIIFVLFSPDHVID